MSKSEERKKDVPGVAYMKKIVSFRDTHYGRGELYMEYLKRDCTKTSHDKQACLHCDSCQWVGPSMSRIPRPWPDELQLPNFHYKDVLRVSILLVVFLAVLITGNLDTTSKKTLIMEL
jgi:hypothetical protein